MILFPYKTDGAVQKIPVVNLIFSAALLSISLLFYFGLLDVFFVNTVIISKWSPIKAFLSIFFQPDLISIIASFVFLFLIGNSLNSFIGNIYYLIYIAAFALLASAAQNFTSNIPAIGIHGVLLAISGGAMSLLPSNKILIFRPDLEEDTGFNIWFLVFIWITFDVYSLLTYKAIPNYIVHAVCLGVGGAVSFFMYKVRLTAIPDATFHEWLADRVSTFTNSEFFASLLPTSKVKPVDVEIKKKAEQLLAKMELTADTFIGDEIKEEDAPVIQPAENKGIKFRLLRPVKQKDFISLYFVYEGEEIDNVSISSENYNCEIFPAGKLKPGDSGSIKIHTRNPESVESVYLLLMYRLNGAPGRKKINFSATSNELRVNV
jgi:membrane associated rhomboid family serine protease